MGEWARDESLPIEPAERTDSTITFSMASLTV
jgi:hypothetical protein